jgi:predicted RNA-binding Zn-ribbon protein involved in translation (DUF1610 family)
VSETSEAIEERVCPRCGEAITPLPIVYGFPVPETFEAAERGEIQLGGCVVGDEDPDFACPACDAPLPRVAQERR